jgi:hypothetical protein
MRPKEPLRGQTATHSPPMPVHNADVQHYHPSPFRKPIILRHQSTTIPHPPTMPSPHGMRRLCRERATPEPARGLNGKAGNDTRVISSRSSIAKQHCTAQRSTAQHSRPLPQRCRIHKAEAETAAHQETQHGIARARTPSPRASSSHSRPPGSRPRGQKEGAQRIQTRKPER